MTRQPCAQGVARDGVEAEQMWRRSMGQARRLGVWLVVVILTLSQRAAAEESRWALLVGIDEYVDPGISSLSGSVNDVVAIREALVTTAHFPSSQVFLLTSDDPGNAPTRGNILRRLEHIARSADSDDLVYLHFSLHAVLDEGTGEGFLLTHRTDPNEVMKSGMGISELRERLEALAAPKRMLVLDGCRNDPEQARGDRDNRLDERFSRGLVITPRV
ncbi:MAG: putative caspase-like protein, partial [Pseudohongiellaceae bacterium]